MGPNTQGPEGIVGQIIAGYRLERMLGMGATGAVYLGNRVDGTPEVIEKTGTLPIERPEQVAIKLLILPWQLTPDDRADFRARFLREAQTLKRLRHPGILSVLDYGEDVASGFTFMVLPYLAGGTLAQYIASQDQPIPLDTITSFLSQLAEAVDYAHSADIVHRDIKPANVLLDLDSRPFISDFSIVRLLSEANTKLTTTGRVMGTPAYMSPEQVAGGIVGPETDIYSLGMVIYEMITGKTAFAATTIIDLIRQQVQDEPPPPRQLRPDLPPAAEAAVLCALAKDPGERFPSAMTFAHAFSEGLRGQWQPGLTAFVPGRAKGANGTERTLDREANQPWPVQVRTPEQRRHPILTSFLLGMLTLIVISSVAIAAGLQNGKLPFSFIATGNSPTGGTQTAVGASPTTGKKPGAATATPRHKGSHADPTATVGGNHTSPTQTPSSGSGVIPTPTVAPSPTIPAPTATPTPCPYLDGGSGVTFYNGSNYTGQSWTMKVAPGQVDTVINLPSNIAGHLNSFNDDNQAWHVVLYQGQNGTGNLGHWDSSQPSISSYWQATQSVKVYVNRSC